MALACKAQQGLALKALRKSRNLSQVQLATLAHVRQQLITSYETGRVDIPFSKIVLLCEAMGIPTSEFSRWYDAAQEQKGA